MNADRPIKTGHLRGVNAAAFTLNAEAVLTASSDATIRVWAIERGSFSTR